MLLIHLLPFLHTALAVDRVKDPLKSSSVRDALTNLDRYNALSDTDFVYDYTTVTRTPFSPGSVLNANCATWPILCAGEQSVAQLNLGPCAMLAPHVHPNAVNIVVSVSGTVKTYMRSENGATDRTTMLTPGKMTVFPRGSMHSMANEGEH